VARPSCYSDQPGQQSTAGQPSSQPGEAPRPPIADPRNKASLSPTTTAVFSDIRQVTSYFRPPSACVTTSTNLLPTLGQPLTNSRHSKPPAGTDPRGSGPPIPACGCIRMRGGTERGVTETTQCHGDVEFLLLQRFSHPTFLTRPRYLLVLYNRLLHERRFVLRCGPWGSVRFMRPGSLHSRTGESSWREKDE
jgi:hypothetical protein